MIQEVTIEEYANAICKMIRLAKMDTSGSKAAAQVLLSAYNGGSFQLDITDLRLLDRNNFETAMTVILGRYYTNYEPHDLIEDGSDIFRNLWTRWENLEVTERGKRECPDCDGWGEVRISPNDENEYRKKPCRRCDGTGRVCRCQ